MSRQDDIQLALFAGFTLKSESDPLMHGHPTVWTNSGRTAYIAVPWYTTQDTCAVSLLQVLHERGVSATITSVDGEYIVRLCRGHATAQTFHEALTKAILMRIS